MGNNVLARPGDSSPMFIMFAAVSVSLVIINKAVMRSFAFPGALLLFQNGMTIVLTVVGAQLGTFEMRPWRLRDIAQFAVQACLMSLTLSLNLVSLPKNAVATLLVFKSLQVLLTAALERLLQIQQFSRRACLCLGAIFLGSLIYAQSDAYYEPSAYILLLVWIVVNSFQQIYERGITVTVDQTAAGCSCYKNLMSLPFLLAQAASNGELTGLPGAVAELSWKSVGLVMASGGLGFGISYCYSTLNKISDSTTITVANNFNKLLTTIAAHLIFAESLQLISVVGLVVSIAASLGYAIEMKSGGGGQKDAASVKKEGKLGLGAMVAVGSLAVATLHGVR